MARQIYRKSMLERMSSPDQLDKMIVITSPSFWLALLGGVVIVVVALIWSIFGRLPINLQATGIFVANQTAYNLASDTGGIVASLEVAVGDQVQAGDVLLTLDNDAMQRELDALEERREKVEAVTLNSINDEVTADNRDLVNLKTQIETLDAESAQNLAMLSVYQSELAGLRTRVNAAKKKMDAAKEDYYDYISATSGNVEEELAFSELQAMLPGLKEDRINKESAMGTAKQKYKDAVDDAKDAAIAVLKTALDTPTATLNSATTTYNTEKKALDQAAANLAAAQKEKTDAEASLAALQATDTTNMTAEELAAHQDEMQTLTDKIAAAPGLIAAAQAAYDAQAAICTNAKNAMDAAQAALDAMPETAAKNAINALSNEAAPNTVSSTMGTYLDAASASNLVTLYATYEAAVSDYNKAVKAYQDAVDAYNAYTAGRTEDDVERERLGALYNQYSSDYNALYSQMVSLQANITSIQGQLRAANVGSDIQGGSYEEQFEATRAAILSSIDAEIEKYRYSLDKSTIRATVSGSITDIKVGVGAAVGQGSEIVTIRQIEEDECIVCYIPISSGKKVTPGMEVIVTPTTVNRQEYGHMKAEVVSVDDYVTTASSIRATLGDDMLAQAFTQSGPVIAVTCRLYTDDTTVSGYWWSNRKGGELYLAEGTLVSVDVVIEEKAPITMLIPYIKDKLTMAVEPGAGNNGEGR